MNSLQDLNNYGSTAIEFDDDRPAKVIFNLLPPLSATDVTNNITTTSYAVAPTIEIAEIINYATADVRYRVIINDITGATISFGTLSGNLTLDTSLAPNVYEITGFTDVADWNTARAFTWNLPVGYASDELFWLDVEIVYYDEALGDDVTVTWKVYDPDNYYIAKLESAFTSTGALTARVDNSAALTVSSSIALIPDATLESNFSLTADVDRVLGPINAPLNTSVSLTANAVRIALDFAYADTQATSFDTEGSIGMFDEYVLTSYNTGFDIWSVDATGVISSDSTFALTSSNENSSYTPSSIYDLDMKVVGDYRYFCQANLVTISSVPYKTTGSVRVWRDYQQSGTWTAVLELKGTTTTQYEDCEYFVATNGYHYLAVAYSTSSDGGATWSQAGTKMYRSTNGTSWTNIWNTATYGGAMENVAMNNSYYMRASTASTGSILLYNITTGNLVTSYTGLGTGYVNVMSALDDIAVIAGSSGHKVINVNTGTVLSTQSSAGSGAWDRIKQTYAYVGLLDNQNQFAVYRTGGDYGAKVATTSTTARGIAISLNGLALRTTDSSWDSYR